MTAFSISNGAVPSRVSTWLAAHGVVVVKKGPYWHLDVACEGSWQIKWAGEGAPTLEQAVDDLVRRGK